MRASKLSILSTFILFTLFLFSCEGSEGPTGPAGPEGDQGPEGPQGPMGNANVTLHVFDGHDFNSNTVYDDTEGLFLEFESESEATQNLWKYYLKHNTGWFIEIPGMGFNANSEYYVGHNWDDANSTLDFFVGLINGAGEQYEEVHIIQIEANNEEDHTSAKEATKVIPERLDTSDYQEVLNYYGDQVDVIQH